MRYLVEREKIVDYGKKLITEKLTTGTGGNISIFLREDQCMLISPSGIPYSQTTPEDIVLLDLDGNVLEGNRKPSSEYDMHRIFYQKTQHVNAVVHTHSEYATSISCLNQEIPAVHYLIGSIGYSIKCCEYKTFGTYELAEAAYKTMGENNGILLGNHGVLATGKDIATAFSVAIDIEFLAKLYIRAKSIGAPVVLSKEDMNICLKKFETYGQVFVEEK